MTESGAHLTTSRVNRLLRPLRNKCNSLAALPRPAAASRVTYLKQSSCWDLDGRPPLSILCHSAGAKKLTLDRRSADEFELARRIYAVCDAFKNIIRVAYSQPHNERIPSLAAMCTLLIGANMPTENTDGTSDEDAIHENALLDGDDVYEAVPPHYRRFLIVSHALSMTLCICVHHHSLVIVLLDHCLSSGLVHESIRLLNIVLAQAFLPSIPSLPPPVTHPAHTNYLTDLHAKWTSGNKPPGTSMGPLLFTTSAFCRVVFDILSQSTVCNSHILWSSNVLDKYLRTIEGCDIDSYIIAIHALSHSLGEILGSSLDATQDDVKVVALSDKLCELMSNLFDLLFTQRSPHSSPLTSSRIHAVMDILRSCHTAQLHRLRMSTPSSPANLPDIVIVFTTHLYVAFRSLIDHFACLLSILDNSSPVPTTFSKLMAYFSRGHESQPSRDLVEEFLSKLEVYSSAFRSEKLFVLDASLWACALHHFETFIASSQKDDSTFVTRYKRRLMEAVDAAERRCFGGNIISSPVVPSARPGRVEHTRRGRPSGHWEWEDMIGSWIRKTPAHKKRRVDDNSPRSPPVRSHLRAQGIITPETVSEPILVSTSPPVHRRGSSTFSVSPSSRLSESEYRTEDGSEYQEESDKENYPNSSVSIVKASKRMKRRSSNFFSLLADAQTNRIVLHPKRRSKPKSPRSIIPENYILPFPLQESKHEASCRKLSPPLAPSGGLLPSDDSLDLFAYTTSSPARR